MRKNIVLLIGEEPFLMHEAISKWQTDFCAKHGEHNFEKIDGKTELKTIMSSITAAPFLGEKRLIIISNFLHTAAKETKDTMTDKLEKIPESSIVIFAEHTAPDKRQKLYKTLQKTCRTDVLQPKKGYELTQWIQKRAQKYGATLNQEAAMFLGDYAGNNLWHLDHELKKLALYADGDSINRAMIQELTSPQSDHSIFNLIDAMGAKNTAKSLTLLHKLESQGVEAMFMFHMLVRQIRILILIHDAKTHGPAHIPKMHPFALKKAKEQSARFSMTQLKTLYSQLKDIEVNLKTGKNADVQRAISFFITSACT